MGVSEKPYPCAEEVAQGERQDHGAAGRIGERHDVDHEYHANLPAVRNAHRAAGQHPVPVTPGACKPQPHICQLSCAASLLHLGRLNPESSAAYGTFHVSMQAPDCGTTKWVQDIPGGSRPIPHASHQTG